jgi:uncharacterized protein
MAQFDNQSFARPGSAVRGSATVDQGLRSYMLGVYNYMAGGVALTGLVAYFLNQAAVQNGKLTELGQLLYKTPLQWVLMLAPLGIVIYMSVRANKMSATWAQGVFWLYAAAVGASISFILMKYTGVSVARTFFVTAAAFAGLSAYGYTTKRDMSAWGAFLVMGIIGVVIASIVQIFVQSSALQFAISVIGLLIFAGFTAYDTQAIKDEYYATSGYGVEALAKSSIFGALALYQDFVGIFMNLLNFMGDRE